MSGIKGDFAELDTEIARLKRIGDETTAALERAARRIQEKLRTDATSRIGKVPDGISVTVYNGALKVNAPDWVMLKAQERGQPAAWQAIIAEELAAALR